MVALCHERDEPGGGLTVGSPLGTGEGDLPWQQPVTSALDSSFEQVLGNLYSTSYANRKLLGDDHERFENDLRERRARAGRFGHFEREIESSWIIGRVAH